MRYTLPELIFRASVTYDSARNGRVDARPFQNQISSASPVAEKNGAT